jgi:nucleotide-binding universal stress UspA family protein
MYTRLLIPLDGSRTAEAVLPYGRTLAGTLKIPIELLGVVGASVSALSVIESPDLCTLELHDDVKRKNSAHRP